MKLLKKIIYLICFFVFLNAANAVVINELVVDPQQDWDSSGTVTTSDEWLELYNNGNNDANLANWKLNLIDSTNETELLDGIIKPKGYLVILNPAGQQNNDGRVELIDSGGNLIDGVTYGNYDDGNLDDNAPDGNADSVENECLARVQDGFVKKKCTKGYSNSAEKGNSATLLINAVVETSAPTIYNIAISPDDSSENGIQVSPVPGMNKTIGITAFVSDSNNVYAEVLKGGNLVYGKQLDFIEYANSTKKYSGNIGMKSTDSAGNYTVKVTASNSEEDAVALGYFEYLGLIGIELDSQSLTFSGLSKGETSYIAGDLDIGTPEKPTVKNIGNVAIDAEISGADLKNANSSILIENLEFRFGSSNYLPLSIDPVINELSLGAGSSINLDLGLFVPDSIASGTYTGAVLITALS